MGLRIVFLVTLTVIVLATRAFARPEFSSHPYFLAFAAAEQCEGHQSTLLEELRLALVFSQHTGTRISPDDIRAELDKRRYDQNTGSCDSNFLDLYRNVVSGMLKNPILKVPDNVG